MLTTRSIQERLDELPGEYAAFSRLMAAIPETIDNPTWRRLYHARVALSKEKKYLRRLRRQGLTTYYVNAVPQDDGIGAGG